MLDFSRPRFARFVLASAAFGFICAIAFFAKEIAFAKNGGVEARIEALLQQMTLEEKITLIDGNDMESRAIPRLGIPSIKMANGPVGVQWDKATSFPSGVSMGATFDPELLGKLADAMAIEALARGRDMLLAPCVNLTRVPQGGRNFESYGEDPYLTSQMASSFVTNLQARGVMASTKHFAGNEQEIERTTINSLMDERTLHEMHLPAFRAAVRAGSWSVMSSYNRLNGKYASENSELLTSILKKEWGFNGFVISDWWATHSAIPSALAGLDMEMPLGTYMANGELLKAVKEGKLDASVLDDKIRRILRVIDASGLMTRKASDRPDPSVVNSPEHQQLTLQAARESIVLLKNENVLPLQPGKNSPAKIAVIGPNAARARNHGGGSSWVSTYYNISPLEGMRARSTSKDFEISHALGSRSGVEFDPIPTDELTPSTGSGNGLYAEYFDNPDLAGNPVVTRIDPTIGFDWRVESPHPLIPPDGFSVRWTGQVRVPKDGEYELAVRSDDGVRLRFGGDLLINDWSGRPVSTHRVRVQLEAGKPYDLNLEYFENMGSAEVRLGLTEIGTSRREAREEAVNLAAQSDVAVVFVGYNEDLEGEAHDRASLSLPYGQDELIEAIAAVNPKTVVVINSGGSVLMPWLDKVAGVVQAWYPGQEGGNAVADLLYGHENFSAKLPVTFYRREADASSFGNYPGSNGQVSYKEGVFVGYRHVDHKNIEPLFPFGFGLSYSTFKIDDLQVTEVDPSAANPQFEVSVQVTNTSSLPGAEVVQVYVNEQAPTVDRPENELKAFQKVKLDAGESKTVKLNLDQNAFAFYDVSVHKWRTNPGKFEIRVGTSSRDLPLRRAVNLNKGSFGF